MRNKIDEVLDDPDTQVGTRKRGRYYGLSWT